MKIQHIICLLYFSAISSVQAQYDSISVQGQFRTFLTHIPESFTGAEDVPLVLALHGGTGNAFNLQNQSQLSVKSDEEGFIVVYPEGLRLGLLNIRTWNAGWCCGQASVQEVDDVGFINQLLDSLQTQYPLDETRVFVTGMSNGGYMSYRLACELSDRIAAIAPVAASISYDNCSLNEPIPSIHFHSYLDENVRYQGGFGVGLADHYSPPLDSLFDIWSDQLNCNSENDTLINDDQLTHVIWADCDCETEIQYYISTDGGHSWPGGNNTPLGDPVSNFLNANDLMWDFFENHPKDCTTNLEEISKNQIEIYPNPTTGKVYISDQAQHTIFKVIDLNGSIVLIGSGSEIDLTGLSQGIYVIVVETELGYFTKRMVKS